MKGRENESGQGLPKISFGKMSWGARDSAMSCSKRFRLSAEELSPRPETISELIWQGH